MFVIRVPSKPSILNFLPQNKNTKEFNKYCQPTVTIPRGNLVIYCRCVVCGCGCVGGVYVYVCVCVCF